MATKLCILCRDGPREVPDRNAMGRPIAKVCRKCHAARLTGDLADILARRAIRDIETGR